jgi:hypothetical protein
MKKRKLVVISGRMQHAKGNGQAKAYVVTQKRLARVEELQSRIAFERRELKEEWRGLRKLMLEGSEVELGPIRAWLEYSMRLTKSGKRTVTKMFIR